jgi:hypothetical protein
LTAIQIQIPLFRCREVAVEGEFHQESPGWLRAENMEHKVESENEDFARGCCKEKF